MDLPATINMPLSAIFFIVGFGFIIFVHELGHFLVAKWVGIKVTQFAVGMGHALLSYRRGMGLRIGSSEAEYEKKLYAYAEAEAAKAGHETPEELKLSEVKKYEITRKLGIDETEYRLNWMPLGGYVKMVGQDDMDPTALSEDPRAFNKKSISARMAVVSAGVIMNGIFAVLFFIVAFLYGVNFPPAEIGEVVPDSPAATTPAVDHPQIVGLETGDRIITINGKKPSDFSDLAIASALGPPGDTIDMVVERPGDAGEPQRLEFLLTTKVSPESGLQTVGVYPPFSLQVIRSDSAATTAMLASQGLKPSHWLTHVDGKPVTEYWQLKRMIRAARGKPMQLTFAEKRAEPGETFQWTYRPQTRLMVITSEDETIDDLRHLLGLEPMTIVTEVLPKGAAEGVIKPGDALAKVGAVEYPDRLDTVRAISASNSKELAVTVLRDGKPLELKLTPDGSGKVGIVLSDGAESPYISRVRDGSPFKPLNLTPGTLLKNANGRALTSLTDLRLAIEDAAGGTLALGYHVPQAGGKDEQATVTLTEDQRKQVAALPWDAPNYFQMALIKQKATGVGDALAIGLDKTQNFMLQSYITIARLVQGRVPAKALRGPLGIVTDGTRVTSKGGAYLMFFLGLISISVAVFNFLPLPIVDGGLAVLLLIEKLRGRPVPPQVASAINMVGLALLGTLFVTVTYHDVVREFFTR